MPENNELLDVEEVADLLGVSAASVNHWRKRRHGLGYRKVGGRVFYDRAEVEAFKVKRAEGTYFPAIEAEENE